MKKICTNILLFSLIFLIIYSSDNLKVDILLSFNICIKKLFPSLIPFMLLSGIVTNYSFIYNISNTLDYLIEKIFKVNKICSFVFIFSMVSGTPTNAKYLIDLYNNKKINENDIQNTLNFCHFNNPIFILSTIGYTFLRNKKIGLLILISHFIASIIPGIILNKKGKYIFYENKKKDKDLFKIVIESIKEVTNTLLLILGIITTCISITTLLNRILNISTDYKFIYGIIEITQGLYYLSISSLPLLIKGIISTFLISFGGLSIHLQVFSIINNKKIRYKPYLISRIIQACLSSIFFYFLYNILS